MIEEVSEQKLLRISDKDMTLHNKWIENMLCIQLFTRKNMSKV